MLGTHGCAVVTSLTSGRHRRGVAARATAAACRTSGVLLSRAHHNLRLLILGRARGCTATVHFNSIQFISCSVDPKGVVNPQDIEHVNK